MISASGPGPVVVEDYALVLVLVHKKGPALLLEPTGPTGLAPECAPKEQFFDGIAACRRT